MPKKFTGRKIPKASFVAIQCPLDETDRAGSLFGRHRGSVRIAEGVDLIAPALDVEPDAQTGREVER